MQYMNEGMSGSLCIAVSEHCHVATLRAVALVRRRQHSKLPEGKRYSGLVHEPNTKCAFLSS